MRLRSTYSDVALSESWSLAGLKSSCIDDPSAICRPAVMASVMGSM